MIHAARYQVRREAPTGHENVYECQERDEALIVAMGNAYTQVFDQATGEYLPFDVEDAVALCDRNPMADLRTSPTFKGLWGWQAGLELATTHGVDVPPRTQKIHQLHEAITARLSESAPGLLQLITDEAVIRERIQSLVEQTSGGTVTIEVAFGEGDQRLVVTPNYDAVTVDAA